MDQGSLAGVREEVVKKQFLIVSDLARNAAINAVSELSASEPHTVTISPSKRNRTAAQHGLYFHWVGCVANSIGEDKDAMHGQLKAMFLLPIFCRDDDEFSALYETVIDAVRRSAPNSDLAIRSLRRETSITKASKDQMREYLDEIKRMCAAQNIHLTVPDQWGWLGI